MFAVIGAIAAIGLAFITGGATAPAAVGAAKTAVTAAGAAARALVRLHGLWCESWKSWIPYKQ